MVVMMKCASVGGGVRVDGSGGGGAGGGGSLFVYFSLSCCRFVAILNPPPLGLHLYCHSQQQQQPL